MTQEDIRKLLGGYAANALTDDERKSLFEAALEDQELFNALHDEDALRELLADPESRAEIRQALENQARDTRRGFWSRPWVLGIEAIALAGAAIVAVVLVRENVTPPPPAPAVQMASRANMPNPIPPTQPAAKEEQAEPKVKQEARTEVRKKAFDSVGSLSAPAPASVQLEATRDAAARIAGAVAAPQIPDAVRRQFSSGFAANAPAYQGPLVRTAVIRSGPAGDAVRVEVSAGVAGYLALYEVDAAGNAKRVYPADEAAAPVMAGVTVQIPDSPLMIGDAKEKLRLVVVPAAPSALGGSLEKATASPAPLIVDIPLGGK